MRPIALTISAFGPFAQETTIDFQALSKGSLYLITGHTGSGKTTIFDAITFALYGVASGDSRKGAMLRSDFANASMETYVSLTFQHQGRLYHIKRSPEYLRPKKRGTGEILKPATAEFTLASGEVLATKVNEANEAIVDLLGIDVHQFRQLVMIAQGDFLRFLKADSRDKAEILRKLFHTDPVKSFQKKLRDQAGESHRAYEETQRTLLREGEKLQFSPESQGAKQQQDLVEAQDPYLVPGLLPFLEQQLEEDRLAQKNLLLQQQILEALCTTLDGQLALARQAQDLEEKLHQQEKKQQALHEQETTLAKQRQELEKTLPQREQWEQDARFLVSQMPLYDRLASLEEAVTTVGKELQNAQEALDETTQALEEKQGHIQQIDQQLDHYGDLEARLTQLDHACQSKEKEELQWGRFHESLQQLQQAQNRLEDCQEVYTKASALYQQKALAYSQAESQYLANQAGLLAQDLQEGQPCPVCGAMHHPNPAPPLEGALSQEQLQDMKASLEEARSQREEASQKAAAQKAKVSLYTQQVAQQQEDLFLETLPTLEKVAQLWAKVQEDTQKALKQRTEAQKNQEEALAYQKERTSLQEALPTLEKALENSREELVIKRQELAVLVSKQEEAQEGLTYPSKEAAQEQLQALQEKIQKHKEQSQDQELRERDLLSQLVEVAATQRALEQQRAEAYKEETLDTLETRRAQAEEERRDLEEKKLLYTTRLQQNREGQAFLEELLDQAQKQRATHSRFTLLADAANGSLPGRSRLAFEQYLQAAYFDEILEAANQRFATLSAGQYRLLRREAEKGRGLSGLDLDVLDAYTGKRRSVNTLSGGEGFLASLSLALGLSDVIQQQYGGVRMEAMFVDEGFGSLDEEALSLAMKVLSQLAGGQRMVGIISHVPQLRDSIPNQIQVAKGHQGSTLQVVTE